MPKLPVGSPEITARSTMELYDLENGLKFVAGQGYTLNVHELTGLQAGLSKLQSDAKYETIYFWGKVFGTGGQDYYIAYGLREVDFEFPSKQFFFSMDDFVFAELPEITEEDADKITELIEKTLMPPMFTGEPGKPLEEKAGEGEGGEGEGEGEAEPVKVLTELHRLALTVAEIDFDSSVVPKGAYVLSEAHKVAPSTSFKGLAFEAAQQLASYVHFRPAASIAKLRALAVDDVMFHANFLDPLVEDLPQGCWAMRTDPSCSFVSLRSLNWQGYVAFHVPGTPKFGGLYFGQGLKCKDLPFLL